MNADPTPGDTPIARAAGRWLQGLRPDQVPAGVLESVRRGMLDCIGVLLAGRDEPVVALVRALAHVQSQPGPGLAPVLVDRGHAAVADAAWIDSVAAHALDFDDTGLDGHPSVVLAPVVQALGHALGVDAVGRRCAYLAGYELWAELVLREPDKHHGKGWHPTAVFGPVAAAAAAAWLLKLDAARVEHALGLAASMAAGVVANFGSMAKPVQVGLAARNGILAAQMAARGVTASADALDGPKGLLAALSPRGRVRLGGEPGFGPHWRILEHGISVKRYPVCYALHRAVDAALALRPQLPAGREIRRAVVELGLLQAQMLRQDLPGTGLEAKFSAPYAVACALVRGHLDLQDLSDAAVAGSDVAVLMSRVKVRPLDEPDPADPLFSVADRVEVTLADGSVWRSEPVRRAKGHASRPLDEAETRQKFIACASLTCNPSDAAAHWGRLSSD
jgi:aconitate decarboxylase